MLHREGELGEWKSPKLSLVKDVSCNGGVEVGRREHVKDFFAERIAKLQRLRIFLKSCPKCRGSAERGSYERDWRMIPFQRQQSAC